jgi:hypothetical protein
MADENVYLLTQKIFKSVTNDGDMTKHYFRLLYSDRNGYSVVINKLVLSNKNDSSFLHDGFKLVFRFKDQKLWFQRIGFKLSTFDQIAIFLSESFNKIDS